MEIRPELNDIDFQEGPEEGIQEIVPTNTEGDGVRAKTPLRFKYEAQVEVLKKEVGDLEDIRTRLGMTRRQMAQLLLVDPSAWTRWVQAGAPPHIYQSLAWYLRLSDAEKMVGSREAISRNVLPPAAAIRETAAHIESKLQDALDSKLDRETGFLYQIQRELQSHSTSVDAGWMQTRKWLLVLAVSQVLFLLIAISVLNR